MKEFLKVLANYVLPYKKYLVGSLLFNLLSAMLNVFSFMSIIPMLQMLFGIEKTQYHFIPWDTAGESLDWFVSCNSHVSENRKLFCVCGNYGAHANRHCQRHKD